MQIFDSSSIKHFCRDLFATVAVIHFKDGIAYLMHFVPALSILNAVDGLVVKESLAKHWRCFG